jgi:uncharacterized membrane protein YgcG
MSQRDVRPNATRILLIACVIGLLAMLLPLLFIPTRASADEGWIINRFDVQIDIKADGALDITEKIAVDFGRLERRGIFRDIPVIYDYEGKLDRVYDLTVESVKDLDGRSHQYEISYPDSYIRVKIGNPDVYLSGPQSYVISYRVRHALNGFTENDELYWNVSGTWPVRMEKVTARVTLPAGEIQTVACYQGSLGSRESCGFDGNTRSPGFESTRRLPEGEQMTIVVAMPKGLVPDPQPMLQRKPRQIEEYFEVNEVVLGGAAGAFALVLVGLGMSWWSHGRDRRFTSMYYLTDDPREETRPLFSRDPIVIEYKPPENLRPGQMGLLLDETANTLDVTATIVDLAVRGYIHIAEIPSQGLLSGIFGRKDWQLERIKHDTADLLEYEIVILNGLFATGSSVKLSDLKTKFYTHLNRARESLYKDAARRKWFPGRPDSTRSRWRLIGFLVAALGVGGAYLLGNQFGLAIVGLPVVLGGIILMFMASSMPRRTALGSEMLRRTLGFRQYVATAEKDRHDFNERENIFAAYLPYAIVFHCVDKWARAFRDIDVAAATQGWYSGSGHFESTQFSRNLQGFSSQVSSTIVSTPGGSGSSGSGSSGGSGGGGGGGGGGSW